MGGLLPSSSRRQSRDLRDYVPGQTASDDHKGSNGSHGGQGRGRGSDRRRRGQQENHGAVRLVRMRTRSNFDQDACWGSEFLVLQGDGDGGQGLGGLLKDTQPVCRWQRGLRRLLATYIRPQDTRQALDFLQKNMDTAIFAVEHPSQSPGYPALFIDVKHKPEVLDLDHWKEIVLALHFEITEPESNRHLDLLEVRVTKQVTLGSLLGLKFLLRSISNLSPDMLRMVLTLTSDEARGLLALMQSTTDDASPSQADMATVHSLYTRYPDQLRALGFSAARRGKSTQWLPQSASASPHHLEVVLVGLFHTGLETFI